MSNKDRSYGQYCPVAAGLDVLGDRWVLLICRELVMGPRRFSDLRAALPGIAPNLLTDRLRALQAAGLVETAELPPPAARTVYQLTDAGRSVAPVLRSLARFGVRLLRGEPTEAFGARRVAHALLAPWRRRVDADLRARLVVGDEAVDVVLRGYGTDIVAAEGEPDVVVTVSAAALVAARQQRGPLQATLDGPAEGRRAFLDAFELEAPPTN